MAIKRNQAGQYIIKTKDEAVRALVMMEELNAEYTALMAEHGLNELQIDITELKRAATAYCADHNIEALKIPKLGKVGKLVRAVNKKLWIGTKDDLAKLADIPNLPSETVIVKPLRSLVSKEVWMQITTRIPDPEKIDEAVAEGTVTAKQIAPAYLETFKSPYLMLVNDNGT